MFCVHPIGDDVLEVRDVIIHPENVVVTLDELLFARQLVNLADMLAANGYITANVQTVAWFDEAVAVINNRLIVFLDRIKVPQRRTVWTFEIHHIRVAEVRIE